MIGRITGYVAVVKDDYRLLETHGGVAYEVTTAQPARVGETQSLWTHQHITDTAHTLYGFANPDDRNTFRRLIAVSGVGPRSAFALMKGLSYALDAAIRHADINALTSVDGIGRKTAENIVKALKS